MIVSSNQEEHVRAQGLCDGVVCAYQFLEFLHRLASGLEFVLADKSKEYLQ